jgi:hypothetical protein
MKRLKMFLAKRRLQKLVERNRNSYATISYRKHREAALKGLGQ